jgi:hypothetical protein
MPPKVLQIILYFNSKKKNIQIFFWVFGNWLLKCWVVCYFKLLTLLLWGLITFSILFHFQQFLVR